MCAFACRQRDRARYFSYVLAVNPNFGPPYAPDEGGGREGGRRGGEEGGGEFSCVAHCVPTTTTPLMSYQPHYINVMAYTHIPTE
jgi:hypothetical protein